VTVTEMTDVRLHAGAMAAFDAAVRAVGPDQWHLPTPNADWDVRTLVNHVVAEARWAVPLLAGRTVVDVGNALDGDLLGEDPPAAWQAARDEALAAVGGTDVETVLVHLSFGDTPALEYLRQLTADYLVHSWDLAVATGTDDRLDPELVDAVAAWFAGQAAAYRGAGAVDAPVPVPEDAGPQRRLLAQFGRDEQVCATAAAVARFSAAFDRRDVDAVMAAMTDDCVFESTAPPDGTRHEGPEAVRAAWAGFFRESADAQFATEEQFVCGDRVVARWRYTWASGHVRGVDVFRVRTGRVAEKLSYVKG
jgi:uncharacterized protein (TIGR03086 family)